MKFALTAEGVTAAQTQAGREGFIIPKDKMLNILGAAMVHVTAVEGGEEVTIPQAHTEQFESEVAKHIDLLWKSLAGHELFLQSGIVGRLRWLFRGHR